jgi:serine/threonine protein kinase
VEQILVDYPQKVFANEELVYLIENDSLDKSVRHAAYLAFCVGGELEDIKRLAHHMDFSYRDQGGNHAFHYAAIYNRPDVMSWLAADVECFRVIDLDLRADIILFAAQNGSLECMRLIDKPKSQGGLGWDINIIKRGCTPVTFAAKAGKSEMLKLLISSREDGGCGLPVDKKSIKILGAAYKLGESNTHQIKYRRKKFTRQTSFIEVTSLNTEKAKIYKPDSLLGKGGFGRVRLFRDEKNPANTLAVKSLNFDSDVVGDNEYELLFSVLAIGLEMNFLKLAYPDESPYEVKVVSDQQGRVDYRAVMPVVTGLCFLATVMTIIESPAQFAALALRVIKEIHRLHELGITHGDINQNNMLIKKTDALEYGLPVFNVHFIDFGSACNRNEDAPRCMEGNIFTPPELVRDDDAILLAHPSQDIYALSHVFGLSLAFRAQRDASFLGEIDKQFPSITKLCTKGACKSPNERPDLKNILESLTSELKLWHKKQNLNRFSTLSASVSDMTLLFKRDPETRRDNMPAAKVSDQSRHKKAGCFR